MRKDLLASSLKAVRDGKQQPTDDGAVKARKPAGILDVQRGLDQLSSGAPRSIDPATISDSVIRDRFDVSDGLQDLIDSIQTSGQRLPVLVRRTKAGPLPYEVVYGRRRIEACRQLGIEVQAYIADMDDREALISQGLENAARLQRSFIEQSVYASRLLTHGFSRDEITEVLAVDKTTISRMLGVVSTVPATVIDAIGPAHDSGRRPWQLLREAIEEQAVTEAALLAVIDQTLPSNDRLAALLRSLRKRPDKAKPRQLVRRDVVAGVRLDHDSTRLMIHCTSPEMEGFTAFVDTQIDRLITEFLAMQREEET